jgi:hypothetical protein
MRVRETKKDLMKRLRTAMALLALGVLSVGLVACDGASANDDNEPTATAPADGTPDGDTPVSPGDHPSTAQPTPTLPGDPPRVEVAAPIDGLDVLVRESFPPQYSLQILSGLPSGCAAFERLDVERDGNTFNVDVINTMPEPNANIACTMIYGTMEHAVALEGIESGVEYTVNVNDQTMTFVGQ